MYQLDAQISRPKKSKLVTHDSHHHGHLDLLIKENRSYLRRINELKRGNKKLKRKLKNYVNEIKILNRNNINGNIRNNNGHIRTITRHDNNGYEGKLRNEIKILKNEINILKDENKEIKKVNNILYANSVKLNKNNTDKVNVNMNKQLKQLKAKFHNDISHAKKKYMNKIYMLEEQTLKLKDDNRILKDYIIEIEQEMCTQNNKLKKNIKELTREVSILKSKLEIEKQRNIVESSLISTDV